MNPLRWRKMTWVLWIWTIVMFVWMIAGGTTESASAHCAKDPSVLNGILTKQECISAYHAGTGIGIALLFVLWVIGFVILGLIWLMSRPRHRQCPVCGEDVKKGATVCKKCGHDFAAAASGAVVAPTQ